MLVYLLHEKHADIRLLRGPHWLAGFAEVRHFANAWQDPAVMADYADLWTLDVPAGLVAWGALRLRIEGGALEIYDSPDQVPAGEIPECYVHTPIDPGWIVGHCDAASFLVMLGLGWEVIGKTHGT